MTDQDILRAQDAARLAAPAPTMPGTQNVVVNVNQKKRVHHGFHLLMTLLTAGLWLPVWLIVAISA